MKKSKDAVRMDWMSANWQRVNIGYYPAATYPVRIYERLPEPEEVKMWWGLKPPKVERPVPRCLGAGETLREAIDFAIEHSE